MRYAGQAYGRFATSILKTLKKLRTPLKHSLGYETATKLGLPGRATSAWE
jgi:hypothetical protein